LNFLAAAKIRSWVDLGMELAAAAPFNTRDNEVGERFSSLASSFKLIGFGDLTWLGRETVGFVDSTPGVSHVGPEEHNTPANLLTDLRAQYIINRFTVLLWEPRDRLCRSPVSNRGTAGRIRSG